MKNIHILPTDKPSRLGQVHEKLSFFKDRTWDNTENWRCKNIYITSDEEIKEGDYYIDFTSDGLKIEHFKTKDDWVLVGICDSKKIILTDNKDLIKDGVQAIDDTFLEWFVKNPSCEEVDVTRNLADEGIKGITYYGKYFIIIPQEEPKQETLTYTEAAKKEERIFNSKMITNQETLEEVIKTYCKNKYGEGYYPDVEKAIKFGAKWQAERRYSEEEVRIAIFTSFLSGVDRGFYSKEIEDKIIQKFKKK
jgi:hypothetical protein